MELKSAGLQAKGVNMQRDHKADAKDRYDAAWFAHEEMRRQLLRAEYGRLWTDKPNVAVA